MGTFDRPRRHDRLSTRLLGRVTSETGRVFSVRVLSLSEGGFYAEGLDLDEAGRSVVLDLVLENAGQPSWSPKSGARSAVLSETPFRGPAELLYLDLGRDAAFGRASIGMGARFGTLREADALALRGFVAEMLLTRERRAKGGAVPRPPESPHAPEFDAAG